MVDWKQSPVGHFLIISWIFICKLFYKCKKMLWSRIFDDEPESDSQEIFFQCQINKNILFY